MTPLLQERLQAVPAKLGAYYQEIRTGRAWSWYGDEDFPAASVIKVPILLTVLRQVQQGGLSLQEEQVVEFRHHVGGAGILFELHDGVKLQRLDLCRLMIVVSDNVASNLLLDTVGLEAVNSFCQQAGLTGTVLGRKFMEAPRPGHDNRTTAVDMGSLLVSLARGDLLDRSQTQRALSILRRQQYREKIPLMLPSELSVAHKTGELEHVRHDVALVEVPESPYVLSLLTEKGGPAWEVDRALAELSRAVYDWHLDKHGA